MNTTLSKSTWKTIKDSKGFEITYNTKLKRISNVDLNLLRALDKRI